MIITWKVIDDDFLRILWESQVPKDANTEFDKGHGNVSIVYNFGEVLGLSHVAFNDSQVDLRGIAGAQNANHKGELSSVENQKISRFPYLNLRQRISNDDREICKGEQNGEQADAREEFDGIQEYIRYHSKSKYENPNSFADWKTSTRYIESFSTNDRIDCSYENQLQEFSNQYQVSSVPWPESLTNICVCVPDSYFFLSWKFLIQTLDKDPRGIVW